MKYKNSSFGVRTAIMATSVGRLPLQLPDWVAIMTVLIMNEL
jgi:hypothetical protein